MMYLSNKEKTFTIIALLVFIVLMIALGPLIVIWSLNTLFPLLAIPYTFWTWLAVIGLNITWMSKYYANRKDN